MKPQQVDWEEMGGTGLGEIGSNLTLNVEPEKGENVRDILQDSVYFKLEKLPHHIL